MKKLLVFCSMIIALGFVVTGCGKRHKPHHAPAPEPQVEAPAETVPEPASEPAPAPEQS